MEVHEGSMGSVITCLLDRRDARPYANSLESKIIPYMVVVRTLANGGLVTGRWSLNKRDAKRVGRGNRRIGDGSDGFSSFATPPAFASARIQRARPCALQLPQRQLCEAVRLACLRPLSGKSSQLSSHSSNQLSVIDYDIMLQCAHEVTDNLIHDGWR
eukprot:2500855-Amphidinium_carterae.1